MDEAGYLEGVITDGDLRRSFTKFNALNPEAVQAAEIMPRTPVTVTPEMGPLEIAPGTHRDDGSGFAHGMFPPPQDVARYAALAQRRMPRRGDASVRTGLTLHRGTANRSAIARPVLILGAVAPEVDTRQAHDLVLTRAYAAALPAAVRAHLRCTHLLDALVPLPQRHDIEGLLMGG